MKNKKTPKTASLSENDISVEILNTSKVFQGATDNDQGDGNE